MSTIQDAITRIQALVGAISTVRQAFEYPPDKLPTGISVVIYPESGEWNFNTNLQKRAMHQIAIDVITPHRDTARDMETLSPLIDSIPNAILKDGATINGTVDTMGSITYELITLAVNDINYIGYRFHINDIKIQTAIA